MKGTRLMLGLLLAGCPRGPAETARTGSAPDGGPALDVVAVTVRKLVTTIQLPGELTPYEVVAIYPRVQGFIDEIRVDRGTEVKRGQVLARLSAPELSARRAEAESRVQADRSSYERLRAASGTPGVVAQHDLELAEAALGASQAHLRSLVTLEDYLVVRAPFDGIVTERNDHPGALVGPPAGADAVPMLRIEQIAHLRLTVAVPEAEVGSVTEGVWCEFAVRTWPGQRFRAEVRRISHLVNERTRTMAVELDFDNAARRITPGMFAEVSFSVRRDAPSILVPASAIVRTTERTFVDRVQDGVVEQVTVQPGMAAGDQVEVFGGLSQGEWVLKRGSEELRSGARVLPRPWTPDGGAAR